MDPYSRRDSNTKSMKPQQRRRGIGLDGWRQLCPSLHVMCVPDNTLVYRQGQSCGMAYIVARGHLKLSRVNARGDAHAMAILSAVDIFGALSADDAASPAADTATAKGATTLYRIPHAQFLRALTCEPRAAAFALDCLARRQAFLSARVEQLLNGDARQRIAAVLSALIGAYGRRCAHGHEVDIRLTQQELAELTGASRPTVSTVLNRLRDQGVVSYTRHHICIENRRVLDHICEAGSERC